MTITRDTPYRKTGDTTREAFKTELASRRMPDGRPSPMLAEADALYDALRPHTRLGLAHSFAENKHDTVGKLITPDMHNAFALRPRGYPEETGERNGFAIFPSYADAAKALIRRWDDPTIPKPNYVGIGPDASLIRYCEIYNPRGDTHPVTGETNRPDVYCDGLVAVINRLPLVSSSEGTIMTDPIPAPGLIPMPTYADRIAPPKANTNAGDNYFGVARVRRGLVFHRSQSDLQEFTAAVDYLRHPTTRGLTDFYIDHKQPRFGALPAYRINRWEDNRAGWANGPYNGDAASADGRAFVGMFGSPLGASVINQDLESVEVAGNYDYPISDATKAWLVQWAASRAHDAGIRHDQWPIAPWGVTFIFGHREFCGVAYKPCPGAVVWAFVNGELIDRVREKLRAAQTATRPAPVYAKPSAPPFLAEGKWPEFPKLGNVTAVLVNDQYKAESETPVLQYASRASKPTRPAIAIGADEPIAYVFESEGEMWGLTPRGERVPLAKMVRLSDDAHA
jgi:hypothetical protein